MAISRSILLLALFTFPAPVFAGPGVSPSLYFARAEHSPDGTEKTVASRSGHPVILHLRPPVTASTITSLESHGVTFSRFNGKLLHSENLYPASIDLDSLDVISAHPSVTRIGDSHRPAVTPALDVSDVQVQASDIWDLPLTPSIDGSGVIVANVDGGMDLYHPAFFKTDGGTFSWLDVNGNGAFDSGTDAVDLNGNGQADSGETLRFYDAPCYDSFNLLSSSRTDGVYDADMDWLYNDANGNATRDYGPQYGYGENSPSFGERIFIIGDTNRSNRLDPGEPLTGLGTSKILAMFDKNGTHIRGQNLLTSTGDVLYHGTAACGIVGGQHPGRRLTGMAPGVDFISINRMEADIEASILAARDLGAKFFMFEFGSWVYNFLDGTDDLDALIDNLHDDGAYCFTATGNLAGPTRKKHALLNVASGATKNLPLAFTFTTSYVTEIYASFLWRGSATMPTINLNLPGYTAHVNGSDQTYGPDSIRVASEYDVSASGTWKIDVLISARDSIPGPLSFDITNHSASGVAVHAYVADDVYGWMWGAQFGDSTLVTDNGTVCSPATAIHDITVGAYDPRGTRNQQGAINDFSSWGDTVDGRRGVDITAPGSLVYSLSASTGTSTPPGGYVEFGGTSSALPHVVGCAALLLQASPSLTPDQLASALYTYALHDTFTGAVPNNMWGYGKLHILDTFNGLSLNPYVDSEEPVAFSVSNPYPNPFNSAVSFTIGVPNAASRVDVTIYNILGQTVFSRTLPAGQTTSFTWAGRSAGGAPVASGLYFARFQYGASRIVRPMSYVK